MKVHLIKVVVDFGDITDTKIPLSEREMFWYVEDKLNFLKLFETLFKQENEQDKSKLKFHFSVQNTFNDAQKAHQYYVENFEKGFHSWPILKL